MRLGATIEDYLRSKDPRDYVEECRKQGYRAVSWPEAFAGARDELAEIKRTFAAADIVVAEVAAWVNPLDPDDGKRQANLRKVAETLATADELEAVCCATVVGSFDPSGSVSPSRTSKVSARVPGCPPNTP